ncbi:hypothetical protein [Thiosocius teredinicola]|uniref:hypothetical protein n=1 Tax=Thiosocius teredinicola TaxID=1973002 RepID=UPI000990F3F0
MADRKLLLLVAGYAIALTWGAVELRHTSPLPAEPDDVDTQPIAPIAVQPDNVINISAFDEIVDRPLFVAGRRPINEAGTEVAEVIESDADAETTGEIEGKRLTAVIQDGDQYIALIEDIAGNTTVLRSGDRIAGWQIESIANDRLTLIAGGQRKTLLVYNFDAARPTPIAGANRPTRRRMPSRDTQQKPLVRNPAVSRTP